MIPHFSLSRFFASIIVAALSVCRIEAQQPGDLAQAVRERVAGIKQETAAWPTQPPPEFLADNYVYINRMDDFAALREIVTHEWRQIIEHFDAVAPDYESRSLIFLVLRELPEEQFLLMLDKALTLSEEGKLDKNIMRWTLFPSEGPNVAILLNNYRDERVRAILLRAKQLFHDDLKLVEGIDRRLSGEAKKSRDESLRLSEGKPLVKITPRQSATPFPVPSMSPQPDGSPDARRSERNPPSPEATLDPESGIRWPLSLAAAILILAVAVYVTIRRKT